MVKDPRWAIEVLRHLRRHDERYRLRLIRGKLQDPTPAAQAYAEALRRDLDELEPSGAVQVLSHTDDVPAALQDVGVVVSSSVRESFHMGLVEGVASGAVPVVRDWPFFPGAAARPVPRGLGRGHPRAGRRAGPGVDGSEETWREAAAEASAYVLDRWDWTVVSRDFERPAAGDPAALTDGTAGPVAQNTRCPACSGTYQANHWVVSRVSAAVRTIRT